jgi:hypothetical protein
VKSVKTVVVIPVGPRLRYDYICDTVDSVIYHMGRDCPIIAVDDSGAGAGDLLRQDYPSMVVLTTPGADDWYGGLYLAISMGMQYAVEHYDFRVLLRLDTDALVIGFGAEEEASLYFQQYPSVGQLGSYRLSCDGRERDFRRPRRRLLFEIGWWQAVLAPHEHRDRQFLRSIVRSARAQGYEDGEHCMGGATFYSGACLRALAQANLLGRRELGARRIGEDHLFAALLMSTGFRMADFATGDLPLGVRWRGLPYSPEELLRRKKKITHSTKSWKGSSEEDIRTFFRKARRHAELSARL